MRLSRLAPYAIAFFSSLCIMVLELVASRLVARHVGASLIVWTSVIGIILAGICLGNVLGGRLADRVESRLALGSLYAFGAALTLGCLWVNALVGLLPGLGVLPWDLRTLLVVTLDFLVPATVLGMVSPVVAKMAVDQAKRTGSALGDVYFWGAVGSIVGTLLAGFYLIYLAPTSTIVAVVAAGLAFLAAAQGADVLPRLFSAGAVVALLVGALPSMGVSLALPAVPGVPFSLNIVSLLGHLLALLAAVTAWFPLSAVLRLGPQPKSLPLVDVVGLKTSREERVALGDLAVLAFVSSLGFMALEMVAGRLVTRHLGSSVYGWTSVIGVLLGGLSLGNYLGGKIANHIHSERRASTLFLAASALVLSIIIMETTPEWLVKNPIGFFFRGEAPEKVAPRGHILGLAQASGLPDWLRPWWLRVLFFTGVQFLLPAVAMGTVSPVVAKLAVDRVRKTGRTGTAIGSVYAWGMVGSILGTFITGFLLIDVLGTKGVILIIAAVMALAATSLGSIWHAAWAGIPLGLCVIAFLPAAVPPGWNVIGVSTTRVHNFLVTQGRNWGLREPQGEPNNPNAEYAHIDESNYYYIKVENEVTEDGVHRTLVLDNLIHGYEILGQPQRLDYDYEHIYAMVTDRVLRAKAKAAGSDDATAAELGTLFLGGGSYTFPRYLQAVYPRTWAEIAEIDPAVTRANHIALGLPWPEPRLPEPTVDRASGRDVVTIQREKVDLGPTGSPEARAAYIEALKKIAPPYTRDPATGRAAVTLNGQKVDLGAFDTPESRDSYLRAVKQWYEGSPYRIRTTWGDARQFVVKHQPSAVATDETATPPVAATMPHDLRGHFDIIYGDAFNDFSVPWHLTTREFNDLLANLLSDQGVYMINIIDLYESDAHAAQRAPIHAMRRRIEAGLRGRWDGQRTPGELSKTAADYVAQDMIGPFDRLGTWAERAFDESTERLDRRRIEAALRAQREADDEARAEPVEVPPVDELKQSLYDALINARNAEATKALDDARAGVGHRLDKSDDRVRNTLMTVLNGVRSEAISENTLPARAQAITESLGLMVRTADRLAAAQPSDLADTITELADELREQADQKSIPALRSNTALLLLAEVYDIARAYSGDRDNALDLARGQSMAIEAVGRVARELRRALSDSVGRLDAVLDKAQRDETLAADLARDVHAYLTDQDAWLADAATAIDRARDLGGFLGSWVETAKLTFPHLYVYGTHSTIGSGQRETFVVVASKVPLDLNELGERPGDTRFTTSGTVTEPKVYPAKDMAALKVRSRGIILTDDYAPVENLLAPVAATRGED